MVNMSSKPLTHKKIRALTRDCEVLMDRLEKLQGRFESIAREYIGTQRQAKEALDVLRKSVAGVEELL